MTKEIQGRSFFRRDDVEATNKTQENKPQTQIAPTKRERPFEKFRQEKSSAKPVLRDTPRFNRDEKPAKRSEAFERDAFRGEADSYSERVAHKPKADKSPKGKIAASAKQEDPTVPIRLNRFISQSGVCSRREADELILSGQVTVNGAVVTELGSKVLRTDVVELEGKRLQGEKKVYIVMNKPKGYITSLDDPHNDKTVIDLLKGQVPQRIYPVGRLDKNTTGVLLLTNDGDLTKELTHPSYEKRKIYHVFLDKPCIEAHLEQMLEGLELEDGKIAADEISFVGGSRSEVGVELHSGRNRIVRRMFEYFGYDIERLDRVYFAGLTKLGLRRGFWRYLTDKELAMLKGGQYK